MIVELIALIITLIEVFQILKYYKKDSTLNKTVISLILVIIFLTNITLLKIIILLTSSIGLYHIQNNNKSEKQEKPAAQNYEEEYYYEKQQSNNEDNQEYSNDETPEEQSPEEEKPIKKVDINTATIEELTKLPYINIIKAKKIIQQRESNIYIESINDLKNKLNLKDYQIKQLQNHITISNRQTHKTGRKIDL